MLSLGRLQSTLLVSILGIICSLTTVLAWDGHNVGVLLPHPPASTYSVSAPISDEAYIWRPVAIGGGGFITGYAADPTGAVRLIRTDVYGAYIWLDDAKRWAQLVNSDTMPKSLQVQNGANEGIFEIVVAPSNPDRIYLALKSGIYRSVNRGKTFVLASPQLKVAFDPNSEFRHVGPVMAVAPYDPDIVFFGSPGNGLFRTENAGKTWTQTILPASGDINDRVGTRGPGMPIWFEKGPNKSFTGRIWVMSEGYGMLVSDDQGKSFKALSKDAFSQPKFLRQGDFASDGAFFGADFEGKAVWRFVDGVWTELTHRRGLKPRAFATIAVNPITSEVYVFDEGGETYRSSNGGETWEHLSHSSSVGKNDPPWLHVSNESYFATGMVKFDPVLPNRMWIAAGTGVYYADIIPGTHHVKWISQTTGIEELVTNDAVQPEGRAPLFAAWDFGIHLKEDLDTFSTTYGPKERVLIAAQQVDWSAGNPDFLVTNASDTRLTCCSEDGRSVLAGFSQDGGKTWTRFENLPTPPGTSDDDPWRMSFGTIAVSANDTKNIVWEPTFNRSPYFSKDRGKSWERVKLDGEILPNTGSHERLSYNRKTLTADRVLPGVFYLVHSGGGKNAQLTGLWRTQDGGQHWDKVFRGEIAPQSQYSAKLRAVPDHAGHLFFTSGVSSAADSRLRRSTDGGKTWSIVPNVTAVDDIAFGRASETAQYPTLFISGRVAGVYGLWRSITYGKNWDKIADFPVGALDQVTVLGADPDVFGRVYIGYQGSGWKYGQPANCAPSKYRFPAFSECYRVKGHSISKRWRSLSVDQ